MDRPKTTPKDFFLWAGAMLSLYVSIFSFIALLFNYINYAFPDQLSYLPDPYSTSIRVEMACLTVLFPVFLLLMSFIRRDIARLPEKKDLWVRRWALVLTIFIAGATVAIDLITLINNFLGGDLTWPFVLKVLVVFLVIGAGFLHFLADLWGYWDIERERSGMVGWGASAAVVCVIVSGFFIMGAPWSIRLYRFDDQKVSDLQSIQSQIVYYWQRKQALPTTLTNLNDSISNYSVPTDPQSGQPYIYAPEGKYSFKLCADFNASTQWNSTTISNFTAAPIGPNGVAMPQGDSWYHNAGQYCFFRGIDTQLYPPLKQ